MALTLQAKREEQDRTRQEAAAKKAEAKQLLEAEEAGLSKPKASNKLPRATPPKVTSYQLQQQQADEDATRTAARKQRDLSSRREVCWLSVKRGQCCAGH